MGLRFPFGFGYALHRASGLGLLQIALTVVGDGSALQALGAPDATWAVR